ncbi:MAG: hypothetical protein JWR69_2177 [Pedosphaera sp.]|nr:hypothetical protein [Pedosphaera sp.]
MEPRAAGGGESRLIQAEVMAGIQAVVSVGPSTNGVSFIGYRINALNMEGYTNQVLQVAFAGTNGQTGIVESSTNLVNWAPVATNVVWANRLFQYFITNSPGQPMRFLRTRLP